MLPSLIPRYSIEEIIFCEDEVSFKKIISAMEECSSLGVEYMLHALGSCSMVGSNDKNSEGTFIVPKKK